MHFPNRTTTVATNLLSQVQWERKAYFTNEKCNSNFKNNAFLVYMEYISNSWSNLLLFLIVAENNSLGYVLDLNVAHNSPNHEMSRLCPRFCNTRCLYNFYLFIYYLLVLKRRFICIKFSEILKCKCIKLIEELA